MLIRTPNGAIDVREVQRKAEDQLRLVTVTSEIKMAIGLLATVTDELEALMKQRDDMIKTMTY